jgi:NAD(P)-dependent dehydrogenase (short-subunit alcohol dehydrogenase family)
MPGSRRGTVLVTGVGRRRSIGAGLALGLAEDGWDLVLSYWEPYDDRLGYARGEHDAEDIAAECRRHGVTQSASSGSSCPAPEAGSPASVSTATAGSPHRTEPQPDGPSR